MSKFTLPNGLKIGDKLYNLVELDEIRGKHQNMLVNPNPKTPLDYVEPILCDMLIDLTNSDSESALGHFNKKDIILNKLPIQDIQFILVKIRETSYGETYVMKLQCPHCDTTNSAKLDLSTLEINPRKDKISVEDMILPKDKVPFKYKHLSLGNLLKMAIQDGQEEFTKEMLTSLTAFMLESLGDNTSIKPSDLDDLKGSDLNYIRDNVPELAEIDMKVEHKCTGCGKDFESELPVLSADFLLHTRT